MRLHIIGIIFLFIVLASPLIASEMESPNYNLESGSFDISSEEEKTPANHVESPIEDIKTILTSQQQELYKTQEYILLLNNNPDEQLIFTISNETIEFNNLPENLNQEQKIIYNIASNIPLLTTMFIHQDSPFVSPHGEQIPHTQCQKTSTPCTITTARQWTDKTVFGLGFKVAGKDTPVDFIDESYYRSLEKPGQLQSINSFSDESNAGNLFFKLNLPKQLAESSYETAISLLIIPQPY